MFASVKDLLRDDPVESMPRSVLVDRVEQVRGLEGAVEAYKARLLTAVDSLGDNGVDGAGMLRSAGRVSSRAAAQSAKRAERLEELPATKEALKQGKITVEHVDAIVDAAEKVSPQRADAELVERATQAPADVIVKETRDWATKNRDDDGADELAAQRRSRVARKWVFRGGDKMHAFYAELDRVDGAAAHASLQARYDELWLDDGGRDRADDVRTREQRMADAFVSLITGAVADTDKAPHPKHQLNVVYDIAGRTSSDGRPLATLVVDGAPLPKEVLERIGCDSTIAAMLFDGPGRPIWVGRDYRHATISQWKALIARDRSCIGCGAAPARCEAHHIIAWADYGRTDIDNLVLVCSRCHHDLHNRGMVLQRTNGKWHIATRAGPAPPPNPTPAPDPNPGRQLGLAM